MNRTSLLQILGVAALFPIISLAQNNQLSGRVTDSHTGEALAGANILIEGTSLGTATNDHGEFKIRNVPPGIHIVVVTYIGYKRARESVDFRNNDIHTLNVGLEPTILEGKGITITARRNADQAVDRETPVPFTIMNQEQLARNLTTGDLPELIREVPGVWNSSAGLGEPEFFMRGFSANNIRFFVNGIPMNGQDDQQINWSNWAGLPNTVNTIQIQRGPAYTLSGSGGFGGSVHIQTMGVAREKGTIIRTSVGFYQTKGIETGPKRGEVADGMGGLEKYSPVNYTYYFRHDSGPILDGRLNVSVIGIRRTGDSYIIGTGYDGYAFGLEAIGVLGAHRLGFSFLGAPQFHNQAFAWQDLELLKRIGREYNRNNHEWQSNTAFKPLWSLTHDWHIADNKTVTSAAYFSLARSTDQSLINGDFDVELGENRFQPVTLTTDYRAFGRHAEYLLENFGIIMSGFQPSIGPGEPAYFRDFPFISDPTNFFRDNHDHSWQNRRRRDHNQFGIKTYVQYGLRPELQIIFGGEGHKWNGHRTSEAWKIVKGIENPGAINQQTFIEKAQRVYDYETHITSLAGFARVTIKPDPLITLQTGGQIYRTVMQVDENPINLFDFGDGRPMDFAIRTSADQIDENGSPRFTSDDYGRDYAFLTSWIGANFNLSSILNLYGNIAGARKEPAILDWYDPDLGPATEDLKPESVLSSDFGFMVGSATSRFRANYYHARYTDKIESVVDFLDRRETINAGKSVYQGVELEVHTQLGHFDFSGSATVSKNRWREMSVTQIFGADATEVVGKVVPFSPEKILSASIGYNGDGNRFMVRVNWWDDYFGTFTNSYTKLDGSRAEARLPYFLDFSSQFSHTTQFGPVDVTFRIDVNNILNRSDNFMRAQYSIDYTRNDALAGQLHWYILQAPLRSVFLTAEVHIP